MLILSHVSSLGAVQLAHQTSRKKSVLVMVFTAPQIISKTSSIEYLAVILFTRIFDKLVSIKWSRRRTRSPNGGTISRRYIQSVSGSSQSSALRSRNKSLVWTMIRLKSVSTTASIHPTTCYLTTTFSKKCRKHGKTMVLSTGHQ